MQSNEGIILLNQKNTSSLSVGLFASIPLNHSSGKKCNLTRFIGQAISGCL